MRHFMGIDILDAAWVHENDSNSRADCEPVSCFRTSTLALAMASPVFRYVRQLRRLTERGRWPRLSSSHLRLGSPAPAIRPPSLRKARFQTRHILSNVSDVCIPAVNVAQKKVVLNG